MACHANPDATSAKWAYGDSTIPQVSWDNTSGDGTTDAAGGNFSYMLGDERKGHNVIDVEQASASYTLPPGMYDGHGNHNDIFDGDKGAFGMFTCAGARGCHGTRSQLLSGSTTSNVDGNFYTGVRRTGIAAISGAHHNSYDGVKNDITGYGTAETVHDGAVVADGYRFIPGLVSAGNTANRWMNESAGSHNEYAGVDGVAMSTGCSNCHVAGHGLDTDGDSTTGDAHGSEEGTGYTSRSAANSYLKVPNNTVSGFCATCHTMFHSSGSENGTSGAFLRHPSDWVIPESGEYAAYNLYDVSAPVARPLDAFVTAVTGGMGNSVSGGDRTVVRGDTDMVMCLSCHKAHASENDYMLRFDYDVMTAGEYGTIALATAEGGCLACHTTKGVLPENRGL
jgi:hypothetical protein